MKILQRGWLTLMVCICALMSGCASTLTQIEPWVKPYERSHLADPIMSMNRNPIALAYLKHALESREGARGADGGAGGGCGCN